MGIEENRIEIFIEGILDDGDGLPRLCNEEELFGHEWPTFKSPLDNVSCRYGYGHRQHQEDPYPGIGKTRATTSQEARCEEGDENQRTDPKGEGCACKLYDILERMVAPIDAVGDPNTRHD